MKKKVKADLQNNNQRPVGNPTSHSLYLFNDFHITSTVWLIVTSLTAGNLITGAMAVYALVKGRHATTNLRIDFANAVTKSGWIIFAISLLIMFIYTLCCMTFADFITKILF